MGTSPGVSRVPAGILANMEDGVCVTAWLGGVVTPDACRSHASGPRSLGRFLSHRVQLHSLADLSAQVTEDLVAP